MAGTFAVTEWSVDEETGVCAFAYRCDRFGDFREEVALPPAPDGEPWRFDAGAYELLRLLHAVLGVSYYKAAAADEITFRDPPRSAAGRDLIEALYDEGLGEFYVRNGLEYPARVAFRYALDHGFVGALGARVRASSGALVAFGGGKDTFVALDLLKQAGVDAERASVVLSQRVADTLQAISEGPVRLIRRRLDPALAQANAAGAYNGHVPITAINSLLLALEAYVTGRAWVVFANERSASEQTAVINGRAVNHQYSKSLEAERLLRAAIAEATGGAVEYFSILRSVSELWIARRLAAMPEALARFRSCNRNFHIDGPRTSGWCGACPKCAFTALITAPFLTRAESVAVCGDDFLNDEGLMPHLADMAGLTDAKPWECVGEVGETRAAIHQLARAEDWRGTVAVARLAPLVRDATEEGELDRLWQEALTPSADGFAPPDIRRVIDGD